MGIFSLPFCDWSYSRTFASSRTRCSSCSLASSSAAAAFDASAAAPPRAGASDFWQDGNHTSVDGKHASVDSKHAWRGTQSRELNSPGEKRVTTYICGLMESNKWKTASDKTPVCSRSPPPCIPGTLNDTMQATHFAGGGGQSSGATCRRCIFLFSFLLFLLLPLLPLLPVLEVVLLLLVAEQLHVECLARGALLER
eukprot:5068527-Pyramimonas_sp.AAC.1